MVIVALLSFLLFAEGVGLIKVFFAAILFGGLLPLLTTLSVLKLKNEGEHFWLSVIVIGLNVILHYSYVIFSAHSTVLQSSLFFACNVVMTMGVLAFYKWKQA